MCQNFFINVENTPVYGYVAVSLASSVDGASVASTSWLLGIMLPETGVRRPIGVPACTQQWDGWTAWEFSS